MSESATSRAGTAEPTWHEAISSLAGGSILQHAGCSGLFELHRRCFSCCNVVLQTQASLVQGGHRGMLLEQSMFTEHPSMKAIMARISDQRYAEVQDFVDDFTKLVETCVAESDRDAVVDALLTHVDRTGQPEYKRPSKATFHGFPHPLLEEMLAQTAMARKKMPPSGVHVTVDVGRYLARAYGMGLTSGAQFIGQPSKEHAFHAQRKKREIEWATTVDAEIAAAESKAQKRNKAKGKDAEGPKKKQKLQSAGSTPSVTPKPNRSLRATRRTPDDGADEGFRSDGSLTARKVQGMISLAPEAPRVRSRPEGVAQRILRRERVHCPHQQGQMVEMCDPEFPGLGKRGVIDGTKMICMCGCNETLKGVHWLLHNGGRPNNRHPGYPWKYMRMSKTKERLADHWPKCDCHEHLCDSCHQWEAPGEPMTACRVCGTSVHALKDCATQTPQSADMETVATPDAISDMDESGQGATTKASTARSRPARRKDPVSRKSKLGGAKGGGSSSWSVDEAEADETSTDSWVCRICSGHRMEHQRWTFNRARLAK